MHACLLSVCPLCVPPVSGKKRKPAWTDRILWRIRPQAPAPDEKEENSSELDEKAAVQREEDEEYPLKIRQDLYTSIMEYSISDHKPVIGIFTLEVRNWLHADYSTKRSWSLTSSHPLSSPFRQSFFFVMGANPMKTNNELIIVLCAYFVCVCLFEV